MERWPQDVATEDAPLAAEWDAYRCGNISALVEAVSKHVRAKWPGVQVSAAIQSYPYCTKGAQEWERWCREKWVDFVCPMDYSASTHILRPKLPRQLEVWRETGTPVYPGMGVMSSRSRCDALECARQMAIMRGMGFPGISFFALSKATFPVMDILAEGPLRK